MSLNRHHLHREAGVTLVEVLVAMVILALSLTAMMALFPQAFRSTNDAGRMSLLNRLASQKIEELGSQPLGHADLSIGTHPGQQTDSSGANYYPLPGYGEEFSLRWIVTAGPTDGTGTPEAGVRTTRVEATYLTRYASTTAVRGPGSLEATLTTYVTD